jgi:shikimate dehydrogenase
MDRYAVIGNPVAHSQSPFIHAAFAAQTGETMEYGRLLCPLDGFEAAVRAFASEGGRGCNVTVPFKFDASRLAAARTPRATVAGACNVLRLDAVDGWLGDNTDGVGLLRDIERNAQVALGGRRILLIGAGGAAAGVLGPLLAAGPAEVIVANRTATKAIELVRGRLARVAPADRAGVAVCSAPIEACGEAFDVVVNAASTSLLDAAIPVSPAVLRPGTLAIDLMYGPAASGFVRWAERHGAIGRDGLGMLVEQAAAAFELFRGVAPETAPVLAALRERMEARAV